MAKYVIPNPPPPGNYGVINVYIDRGITVARMRNPLSSSRVKTAPEFAGLRRYSDWLAIASPLASAAHRTLPENRRRKHYQQLAGKAIQWLKEGKSIAEVKALLTQAAAVISRELWVPRTTATAIKKKIVKRQIRQTGPIPKDITRLPFNTKTIYITPYLYTISSRHLTRDTG